MSKFFICRRLTFKPPVPITFFCAGFIILFFAACSEVFKKPETSQTSQSENSLDSSKPTKESHTASPTTATERSAGICENSYYPIMTQGREYRTSGTTDSGSYVLTHSKKGDESFTETRIFSSGIKLVNNWECTPDGLRNVQYNNMLRTSKAAMDLETVSSSGVTLPKDDWKVGRKWTTNYEVKADFEAGPIKRKVDGTVEISNEIVAKDQNISVPAGNFDAAQVDSEIVLNLRMGGQKLPSATLKMSAWYSPEVGLVKQVVDSSFGKETFEYAGIK